MRVRLLPVLALISVVSGFTACGGSSGGSAVIAPDCDGTASGALCLTACNLGCTTTGCELTEIAQNQPLIFTFSKDIDPLSVTTASVSLKTAQGEEPVGRYFVNGNRITFQPEVRPVGGTTFFGFDPGAVYELRVGGGAGNINGLVSTSGDRLQESFTCLLSVTLGVLDLDGLAPKAELLEPRVRDDVARELFIKLEFSEIIDVGPFFGTNAATGPIRYLLRQARAIIDPDTGEDFIDPVTGNRRFECKESAAAVPLFGAPRVVLDSARGVSVVSYRTPGALPRGGWCVEIVVTDRVRDLAGTPARLQVFQLFTEDGELVEEDITEEFKDETNLDRDVSSGTWSDAVDPEGEGSFGRIGGEGSHGEFSLKLLKPLVPEIIDDVEFTVFEMDTERTVIPNSSTIGDRSVVVSDGKFEFSSFILPRDVKLVFKGSNPPQFHVRGKVDIGGIIDLRGQDVPVVFDPDDPLNSVLSNQPLGQLGGRGGSGGGDGGAGAHKPDGFSLQARFNGQDGEGSNVLDGHAYSATAADAGGKGSPMTPPSGLAFDVAFNLPPGFPFPFQSGMVAAGGGGGGLVTPGVNGTVAFHVSPNPVDSGQDGQGGAGFPDLFPVPAGKLSHQHFFIPGSGGGGAGGHPFNSFRSPILWYAGGGGGGGAGAILFRAGHRLEMDAASQILVSGGSGGVYDLTDVKFQNVPPPSPGGGGSGGAIVLQCENADEVSLSGFMDVRGGRGTETLHQRVSLSGGNGSDGLIRLETPLPVASLGAVEPLVGPNRTGELVEVDPRVAFQSRWRDTGQVFPPTFVRYVLDVEIDGVPITYSDDPAFSNVLAGPGGPVVFRIQGAILDFFTGEPDPQNIRPWRLYVGDQGAAAGQFGLVDDAATGIRFLILLDRSVIGAGVEVKVKKVTVVFKA